MAQDEQNGGVVMQCNGIRQMLDEKWERCKNDEQWCVGDYCLCTGCTLIYQDNPEWLKMYNDRAGLTSALKYKGVKRA